jgi:hypothetical protein
VQAGFVAVEEVELFALGQTGKGVDERFGGLGSVSLGLIEKLGFDPPEAAHPPTGGYHFVDEILFDVVGGLEFLDVIGEDLVEDFTVFAFQNDAFGEEAVAKCVHGRSLAPSFGFGAT